MCIITTKLFDALIQTNNSPVAVGTDIIRFQAYGFIKIFNSASIPAKDTVSNSPVIVGFDVIGFNGDCFVKILDG
ncbi:MAG: hypothetical protein ABSE54_05240 [Smithella sp.]